MIKILPCSYGFKITFEGVLSVEDMTKFYQNSVTVLKTQAKKPFRCMIDMVGLGPLSQEAKGELEKAQKEYLKAGMDRSAVVVSKRIISMQMSNTAKESGIATGERYFNQEDSDWSQKAEKWLIQGVEPK